LDDETETSLHVPTRPSFDCAVSREGIAKTSKLTTAKLQAQMDLEDLIIALIKKFFHFASSLD
jgi:hypothetical protein